MATALKRVSITLPRALSLELEQLKSRYYGESEGEILRILIQKGLEAGRTCDGMVFLSCEEPSRTFQRARSSFTEPVELPTGAVAMPFGRFYIDHVEEESDGGIRKVSVNVIVNEEASWETGYLTADNILYFRNNGLWESYRVDGKILRGRKAVKVGNEVFLPIIPKGKKDLVEVNEPSVKCTVDAPYSYFFSCSTERLYKYEKGLLKPLRSAERGL